jgi:hypothetical protein
MADATDSGVHVVVTDASTTIVITWKEFAEANYAVEQALKFFNGAPLMKRLRGTAELLPVERNIVADIIEGKIKRPSHRVAQPSTHSRKLILAMAVAEAMFKDTPRKAAISDVAKANGASVATVSKAFSDSAHLFPGLPNK